MPPKAANQPKLSSFFKRAAPPTSPSSSVVQAASKSAHSPQLIPDDDDSNGRTQDHPEAPAAKRLKTLNGSQRSKEGDHPSRLQHWRFVRPVEADPVVDSEEVPLPSSQRSVEEDRRHNAFRLKLLGSNDPIKRWDDAYRRQEEVEAGGVVPQEAEDEAGSPMPEDEDDGEAPDDHCNGASGALGRFASTSTASRKSTANGQTAGSGRKASSSSSAVKYTPLEQQVVDLKKKHPDVLLFFEVGYKFIAYEEDAVAASKELNIACFPKNHLRQASIPVHRLHIHARRLVNSGFKVGVVRQTETRALKAASTNAYTPFTRELTELYTASTWVEDLDAEGSRGDNPVAQNSLVALVERLEGGNYGGDERVSIGLICVQAATGVVIFDQFADSSMRSELETRLAHLQPAELLLPPIGKLSKPTEKLLRHLTGYTSTSSLAGLTTANKVRTERTPDVMSYNDAFSQLSAFYEQIAIEEAKDDYPIFDVDELERELNGSTATTPSADTSRLKNDSEVGRALAFIMKMPHLAIISLATCLRHLQSFGLSSVFKVASSFMSFQARSEMLLSTGTLYNLELFSTTEGTHKGSLFWLLDKCKTTFGKRLLKKWIGRPLTDLHRLKERTDAVSEFVDGGHSVLKKVPELLIQQPDLEKGLARILYGRATPNELATVLLALNRISQQFDVTDAADVGTGSTLLNESIAALPRIKDTVVKALSEIRLVPARKGEKENMFVEEKYPQLQEEKDRIALVDSELSEHLLELRKLLKRPTLDYATVSGIECLVEVRVADAKKVPADWLRMSATKSMVRFHTPTVMHLLKGKNRHKELLAAEAAKAYQSFLDELCEESTALRNAIAALGTLDALLSLAAVATLPGYVKPTYVEGEGLLSVKGLRHPMSEALRDDYVPNDISLGRDSKGVILTGANMGGKSSTVRAIALCVVLGQIGSYVPASSAEMTIHDAVLTRMGASDELAKGRSTFMVEAEEAAEIMRVSTSRSLVILDEMGRGTSTFDGQAIASSILTYLMTREETRRPTTLFITHHTSLCDLAGRLPGLRNMHMEFVEVDNQQGKRKDVVFLYKLKDGPAGSSFGIHCASLAGLPSDLLEVATQRADQMQEQTESRLRLKRLRVASSVLGSVFAEPPDDSALVKVKQAVLKLGVSEADDDQLQAQANGLQAPPQTAIIANTK